VFGVVLELFIVKKELLAGSKNKLGATVDALQRSIGEFHGLLASQGITPKSVTAQSKNLPVSVPCPLSGGTTRARTALKVERHSNFCPAFRAVHSLHARRVLGELSRFSGFCGFSALCGDARGLGASNIAAKASIDRNWRNATVYSSRRAVPFQSSFGVLRLSSVSLESRLNGRSRGG